MQMIARINTKTREIQRRVEDKDVEKEYAEIAKMTDSLRS